VDPGYDPRDVITFRAVVPAGRASGRTSAGPYERGEEYRRIAEDILAEVRRPAFGGVVAGAVDGLPLGIGAATYTMRVAGRAAQSDDPWVQFHRVTPGYLEALRIELREGRPFNEADRHGAPDVALVNEIAARRFWPGESVLGKQVFVGGRGPITVVGVVGAVRHVALDQEPMPELYRPWHQDPAGLTFVVRHRGSALLTKLRAPNAAVAGHPIKGVQTLDAHVIRSIELPRLRVMLFAFMAALVLILAAIGVWGVTAHSVTRRIREIGIRMALGALPGHVQRLILRQATTAVALGTTAGILAAFWATTALQRFLFETSARDPLAFTSSAVVLAAVALAAAYIPARRATRIDPAVTLRLD
jgi:putative ABC transport system permease protein